jgi:hypothetical protein
MATTTRNKVLKYSGIFIVSVALLFFAYVWLASTWSYSTGDRAGYLQKLSLKGWICKTWEGELSLVAIPGAAPEKFLFTVKSPTVASTVEASMGKRVTLLYEQHKGLPTSCFGETEYFVVGIKQAIQ